MHSFEDLNYSHCFFRISFAGCERKDAFDIKYYAFEIHYSFIVVGTLSAKSQTRIEIKTGRRILHVLSFSNYIMVISQTSHSVFQNIFFLRHSPNRIASQQRENGMPTKRWEIINNIWGGNGKMGNAQVWG